MGWREEGRERVKDKQSGASIKITPDATTCLRILPNKKDLQPNGAVNGKGILHPPYIEFRIHRHVGPDDALMGCGIDIDGKGDCWLCRKVDELSASKDKGKQMRADKMQVQEQFIVVASRFDTETGKFTTPKPWWVSTGSGVPGRQATSLAVRVHTKMVSGKRDIVDPNKGYNINVERTGDGMKTRYPAVEVDESPSKVPAAILTQVKALEEFVVQYDEEDAKAAYFGKPRRGESEETEESTEEEEQAEEATTEESEEQPEYEQEPDPEEEPEFEPEPEPEPEEEEPEPEPPPRRTAPKPPAKKTTAPARPPARTAGGKRR